MNETPTNDEIERQVALIERWTEMVVSPGEAAKMGISVAPSTGRMRFWKCPVTDDLKPNPPFYTTFWALCGPLLEKMQASVFVGTNFTNVTVHPGNECPAVDVCDRDTKRAICLAYIEAKGGARLPNIQRNPG